MAWRVTTCRSRELRRSALVRGARGTGMAPPVFGALGMRTSGGGMFTSVLPLDEPPPPPDGGGGGIWLGGGMRVKVAMTVESSEGVKVQGDLLATGVHATPEKEVKVELLEGVAVKVTEVPPLMVSVQSEPQSMPEAATVPEPVP